MKKIFFGLLLFLSLTGASFAQSSMMATLSHEGEISVFYGPDAFRDAHAAAKHGDAIALSGGTFEGCYITKAITLRGAGWERDTIRNTIPTKIEGSFMINISDTVPQRLTIEGIYFYGGDIQITRGLKNATFIKTRFNDEVRYYNYSSDKVSYSYKNNSFIQCAFDDYIYGTEYHKTESSYNFINCYINGISNYEIYSTFTNCVISNNFFNLEYSTLNNCILRGIGSISWDKLPKSSFATNCVVYNSYYGLGTFINASPTNKASSAEELWADNGILGALTDEAKAKFLGDDGTEVGIYGGPFPFTSVTTNPQITKCNVASRSTADGKLSIDIEVKAGE